MTLADDALDAGLERGPAAAVVALEGAIELADVVAAYGATIRTAYWEHQDLAIVTAVTYAGLARLLALADTDEDHSPEALRAAAGLCYNLASFTWPGWDEPGVELDDTLIAAGVSAARSHVELLERTEVQDLERSRGEWMLGASLLTSGEFTAAADAFARAARHADDARATADARLSVAFGALAKLAASGTDDDAALSAALAELATVEDGDAFVAQVETAREVLGRT